MAQAFIGLGSNIGDRRAHLKAAVAALRKKDVPVRRVSCFIETLPQGKTDQPNFLNAVAELQTQLSARDLLALLRQVESELGRVRAERWGPRVIDLDLLLYGREVIREADLEVPHPRMHERLFVLQPLAEIAPEAFHPVLRATARQLLKRLVAGAGAHAAGRTAADRSSSVGRARTS